MYLWNFQNNLDLVDHVGCKIENTIGLVTNTINEELGSVDPATFQEEEDSNHWSWYIYATRQWCSWQTQISTATAYL